MKHRPLKVGILTFHEIYNPGAFLQAYATQVLLKQLGHDPEIINYNPPAHRYHPVTHAWRMRYKLPLRGRMWLDAFVRDRVFTDARKRHMSLSPRFKRRSDMSERHYDAVLVGADIVWNYKSPNLGRDPVYFGEGIRTDRLIAFAPSCGACSPNDNLPQYVIKGLPRFDHISVRDENTARIVEKVCGQKPRIICDPTFHILDQIEPDSSAGGKGNYILVYLLPSQTSKGLVSRIADLREQTGLPIHAVLYRHKWADRNVISCDPFHWMDLIRNASYFITNTFHGTIFGAFHRSRFAVEMNDAIRNKTEGLIRTLGISGLQVDGESDLRKVLNTVPDFDELFTFVRKEATEARSFLEHALQ